VQVACTAAPAAASIDARGEGAIVHALDLAGRACMLSTRFQSWAGRLVRWGRGSGGAETDPTGMAGGALGLSPMCRTSRWSGIPWRFPYMRASGPRGRRTTEVGPPEGGQRSLRHTVPVLDGNAFVASLYPSSARKSDVGLLFLGKAGAGSRNNFPRALYSPPI
jgi:hypothetical protein